VARGSNLIAMFFALSKSFSFLEQPLNWAFTLIMLATLLAYSRHVTLARRLYMASAMIILVTGIVVLPELLLQRLEDLHPREAIDVSSCEGVIVLGGAFDTGLRPLERNQILLSGSSERVTTAVALARDHPQLKILHTGYSGKLDDRGWSEADMASRFFAEQGLAPGRVLYENRSRDTYENAMFSRQVEGVDAMKRWLMITSARHMPRAMAVFRKAGWNVVAWPVDYVTGVSIDYLGFSILGGAGRWQMVLHELLGLALYRAAGRL
jgi:uncharacterized SAM-binding protein YcdF (DUF218 family)